MGLLQLIYRTLRPLKGKEPTVIVRSIGEESIPAYRKALIFISKDTPPENGSGTCIRLTVGSDGSLTNEGINEPSTIYERLPVDHRIAPAGAVPAIGYFPSYTKMSPSQRSVYLNWLCDVTKPVEIGYVFVYYYGLERHLVYGNFDAAVDEILLLRQHHDNGSFQTYSATALVHACLIRRRIDTLKRLYLDLQFDYFGNSALLILHQQGLDLLPDMLVRLALSLNGVNRRYIKEKCPMYQVALLEELRVNFGKESYPFADNYPLASVKGVPFPIFANISFPAEIRTPSLPNLLRHEPFQREFEAFFHRVHEKAKLLRRSRKKLPPPIGALPNGSDSSQI